MPTELNTPNHRYYQRRYNIALPKEDMSKDFIFASGIAKIDAWIDLLAGVPAGAIQQRDGAYILDRSGNYIEVRA